MSDKRFGKPKTIRHEVKQHVVVPFPGIVPADRERHPQTVVEPRRWFRFRLRNGFTGAVPMLERDIGRVSRLMQKTEPFHTFAVFDSPTRRIGLNLRHMSCSQFDGCPGVGLVADAMPDTGTVDIVFSDSKEPVHIEVGPDELALSDRAYRDRILHDRAAAALVQVAILFSYCESMRAGSDRLELLQDVTCSSIWIRLNAVALVSAPIGHIKAEWGGSGMSRETSDGAGFKTRPDPSTA
jgi:hypothetical protein